VLVLYNYNYHAGADIRSDGGEIRVANSIFANNTAESNRIGGFHTLTINGEIYVINNSFFNNIAPFAAGSKAMIYNSNALIYIANNICYSNTQDDGITPKDLQVTCSAAFAPTALHIRHNHFTVGTPTSIYIRSYTSHVKTNNLLGNPYLNTNIICKKVHLP